MEQALSWTPLAAAVLVMIVAFWALDKIPALKGLRVVIMNAATVAFLAVPAMLEFLTTVNWEEYLPADRARWLLLVLAVANIYFRIAKTTTPFGKTTMDSAP